MAASETVASESTALTVELSKIAPTSCFLDLPLEIRQRIYEIYLEDLFSPPAKFVLEEVLAEAWPDRQAPLLTASRQVWEEVLDVFRRTKTFTYRVSWQDATFDGLARSCFLARGEKPDLGNVQHLKVEIYPPHRDRPTDMVHIWRHVQMLCYELRTIPRLPKLSVVFLENEISSWSFDGRPRTSMCPCLYDLYELYGFYEHGHSDIAHICNTFGILTNKPDIILPESLRHDQSVQNDILHLAELSEAEAQSNIVDLNNRVDIAESDLKSATGEVSVGRLMAFQDNSGTGACLGANLRYLKKIMPYSEYVLYALDDKDCLYEEEDFSTYEFLTKCHISRGKRGMQRYSDHKEAVKQQRIRNMAATQGWTWTRFIPFLFEEQGENLTED